jgi:lipopolysaccharide transport system permease protein
MNIMLETIHEAWKSRRVWWFTATARTRARFARTMLGSFWLGLSNLLSIAVLAAVYGTVFKISDFRDYVVYLGISLVIWNSLSAAISSAPNLLEHNAHLLKNTNLNPFFYVLEEWSFHLQTFVQSFLLVVAALAFVNGKILIHLITLCWLPLANLLFFMLWLPMMVCLLGARYRDLYQLVPIALQLVFLLSPILYYRSSLGRFGWAADWNPIYQLISPVREAMINGHLEWQKLLIMLAINCIGFAASLKLLEKERPYLPFLI